MTIKYNLDSSSSKIHEYYTKQAGGYLPAFRGSTIQRGSGIGGIFSKLMRNVVPMLTKGAKLAGKQLLSTGMNIAGDLIDGQNLADSAQRNFKRGGRNLLGTLSSALEAPKMGVAKRKRSTRNKAPKSKRRRLNPDIFA